MSKVLSPHLSIYKPQFSSTLSIFNRISGAILSFAVMIYGYVIYYFSTSLCTVSSIPIIGSFISQDLISIFSQFIVVFMVLATVFHLIHSFRHFLWDQAIASRFENENVTKDGIMSIVICLFIAFLILFI